MLTLRADTATKIDPDDVMLLNDLPSAIILSTYNPASGFMGIYWDVSNFNANTRLRTGISWTASAATDTYFMIFGAALNNDPRTASDSVYIEMGRNSDGYITFKLSKRIADVLTTETHVTTRLWSTGSVQLILGLNATTQELIASADADLNVGDRQTFAMSIPPYTFNRVYEFASSASVTPAIADLRMQGLLNINTGFVFNKNKTVNGNMVDYIKNRTGLSFIANDISFSNIRGPASGDVINNTRIDIAGTGTDVLTGNYTLSYKRIPIYQIYPLTSKYEELYLAEPFTAQSIITAYNTQYGMNLTTDDVILTPSSGATYNEMDTLTMEASPNNPCLEGTIYITLYHPV